MASKLRSPKSEKRLTPQQRAVAAALARAMAETERRERAQEEARRATA